jgi:hypothetical protein
MGSNRHSKSEQAVPTIVFHDDRDMTVNPVRRDILHACGSPN